MKKIFLLIIAVIFYIGCEDDSVTPNSSDIPSDPVGISVPVPQNNNVVPAVSTPKVESGIVSTNLTGMIGNNGNAVELFYDIDNPENSTVFVTEDFNIKGVKVEKVGTSNVQQADIVFTVDNSGSMAAEADSVASGIISFAEFLVNNGLDVRFGIVGYSSYVRGAINFTNDIGIKKYLERSYGTNRTKGFAGPDSLDLENFAISGFSTPGENGARSIFFADSFFSWRAGAQRVFINFTDEPNQSDGINFNISSLCTKLKGIGTVHTVFSQDTTYYSHYWSEKNERPWEMSECTGGTTMFLDSHATNLNLTTLSFSTALVNSYTISYKGTISNSEHEVSFIINAQNGDGMSTVHWTY